MQISFDPVVFDPPAVVVLDTKKPHEKEPANAWFFRQLISPSLCARVTRVEIYKISERGIEFGYGDPIHEAGFISSVPALLAMLSYLQHRHSPLDQFRAAGTVIASPGLKMFALTQKNALHPTPVSRRRFSLLAGGLHEGETFEGGWMREHFEEIRCRSVAEQIAKAARHKDVLVLPSVLSRQTIAHFYALSILSWEEWQHMMQYMIAGVGLSEAMPVIMTREQFVKIYEPQEQQSEGSTFLASHHLILRDAINKYDLGGVPNKSIWRNPNPHCPC
jgi:hypothetical protein